MDVAVHYPARGFHKAGAALFPGGEVEAGESVLEPVTPSAFLEATQQLLQQATAYQDELKLVAAKRSAVSHHLSLCYYQSISDPHHKAHAWLCCDVADRYCCI